MGDQAIKSIKFSLINKKDNMFLLLKNANCSGTDSFYAAGDGFRKTRQPDIHVFSFMCITSPSNKMFSLFIGNFLSSGQIQIFIVTGYSLPSAYIAKQTLLFSLQFVNSDYWTIFWFQLCSYMILDFVPSLFSVIGGYMKP